MNGVRILRVGIVIAIVALLVPVTFHVIAHEDDVAGGAADFGDRNDTLFVTTQGTETLNGSEARAIAIDTQTGETVWSHTEYERYFDVEPVSNERVLFLGAEGPHGANMWANVVNWRTGELVDRFRVPDDTHDVDPMGDDRYAVADIENDRMYVYDRDADEITWQYRFRDHFSSDVGGSDDDYTHLNDVDVFDDGSTFLVSPRNFDRVMLLDRSEERIEWTLGAEDDYSTLYEQHNPALLARDPPVVLVADSENDRIVEYRRNGSEWEQIWAYRGGLTWPRDADRLPNGNTLVVDSNGQRVLEVTPDREVVWDLSVTKNPYDADLLSLGDEPTGPSMLEFQSEFDGAKAETGQVTGVVARLTYTLELLQWVVPWDVRFADFLGLLGAATLGTFLVGGETRRWRRSRDGSRPRRFANGTVVVGVGLVGLAVGSYLLTSPGRDPTYQWLWRGVGLLTVGVGALSVASGGLGRSDRDGIETWLPSTVAVLCGLGSLGLVVATGWVGLNVGVGAVFALEALRHVPSSELGDRRWLVRPYLLATFAVRVAALAVAALLMGTSTGEYYETVYLTVSVLLATTAVGPLSTRVDSRTGSDLRTYVLTGVRTVFAGVAIVTVVGLAVAGSQSTSLSLVYLGVAVPLVRIAWLLLFR